VPGTRASQAAGFTHGIAEARQYLDAVIGTAPDDRREIYLQSAPEVIDYLERRSEVKFAPYARHPDYLANRPGATLAGRPLAPLPFDGRLLDAYFDLLRPPIGEFMALGGMMLSRSRVRSHRLPRCAQLRHYYGGMPAIACATAAARAFSWGMRSPGGSSSASYKIACRSGATLLWKSSHYPAAGSAVACFR
jgi:hypothetical protein